MGVECEEPHMHCSERGWVLSPTLNMESMGKEEGKKEEQDDSFHKLKDLRRPLSLCLFKQLSALFTVFLETYVHPRALAAAITPAGATSNPLHWPT